MRVIAAVTLGTALALRPAAAQEARPRARDLGVAPGVFQPGPLNAITDVAGVTPRDRCGRFGANR
jgi:D-aminopeptidase